MRLMDIFICVSRDAVGVYMEKIHQSREPLSIYLIKVDCFEIKYL